LMVVLGETTWLGCAPPKEACMALFTDEVLLTAKNCVEEEVSWPLRIEDFSFSRWEEGETSVLMIECGHLRDCHAKIPYRDAEWSVRVSPGVIQSVETLNKLTWKQEGRTCVVSMLSEWAYRVCASVARTPMLRMFQEEQDKIREAIKGFAEDFATAGDLTMDQIRGFQAQMDALKSRMEAELETVKKGQVKLKKQLAEAIKDIEYLKEAAESLERPGLVRAFLARALNWGNKNKEKAALVLNAARVIATGGDGMDLLGLVEGSQLALPPPEDA